MLFLPAISSAGTKTTFFTPLGTITISSGTNTAAGPDTIVVDTETMAGGTGSSNPLTWSITLGNGSGATDKYVTVGCAGLGVSVTAVTVGSQTLSRIRHDVVTSTNWSELWGSTHTLTGAQTISVTPSAGNSGNLACGAVSFTGVSQTNAVDVSTGSTQNGTAQSVTWTTTNANEYLIDVLNNTNNTAPTVGSLQLSRWNVHNTTQGSYGDGSTKAAPTAGSQTMSWTIATTNTAQSAAALNPGP